MIQRPPNVGAFQFVVLAALRAAQLTRGCLPRVDGVHKATVIAQLEVSAGRVVSLSDPLDTIAEGRDVSDARANRMPAIPPGT